MASYFSLKHWWNVPRLSSQSKGAEGRPYAAAAPHRTCVTGGQGGRVRLCPRGWRAWHSSPGQGHSPGLLELREHLGTALTHRVWVCVVLCEAWVWKGPPGTTGFNSMTPVWQAFSDWRGGAWVSLGITYL